LIELLRQRADKNEHAAAYRWLQDGEVEAGSLACRELDLRARAIAAQLQTHISRGARVLLLYPAGLEFICGLFGCLYAGAVPVPALAPRSSRDSERFHAILLDCQPEAALTASKKFHSIEQLLLQDGVRPIATDLVPSAMAEQWVCPPISSQALAYLQYTSGSTVSPRGVLLTHQNVLENLASIADSGGFDRDSVSVCWLPHFHDLGLVYGIFQALYSGLETILFSPLAFVQRPIRWLKAISRYRGTHCGAPNFGYEHCIRRISASECSDIDLTSWRVAFSGAEQIQHDTLVRFAREFAPYGFREKAFYPV
jgi:acyl-CoA synthetase (AMP-forming)/AMP-acid ligase II